MPAVLLHRIQLRGPWQIAPIATPALGDLSSTGVNCQDATAARTAHLPAAWQTLFGDYRGRAEFRRRFHRPTNLDPNERVCIEFSGVGGNGTVSVNGRWLGVLQNIVALQSFDVTNCLTGNDELVVELAAPTRDCETLGGLYGSIALAIYRLGNTSPSS